jgi:hypothetical protein
MARKMTLRDAFASFSAAEGRNQRWSWSARSEDGETVVLAIWDFDITRDGDKVRVDVSMGGGVPKLGNKERVENLVWARDRCGGLFHVVVVTAKDREARPRSIAKCSPAPELVMKLTELDEATGAFRAESI